MRLRKERNLKVKKNCLNCKKKCPPAIRIIEKMNEEPWTASKALDFLYSLCQDDPGTYKNMKGKK